MLKWLRQLFNRNDGRYTLKLADIKQKNAKLICVFTEKDVIGSIEIGLDQVLSTVEILKNISPDVVLALKEISVRQRDANNKMKIISTLRGNEYQLRCSDGLEFKLSGEALCNDLKLLEAMSIQDAFKIIYETGYSKGISHYKKVNDEINVNNFKSTIKPLALRIVS